MKATIDVPDRLGAAAIDAALEGLVGLGVVEMQTPAVSGGPNIRPLYDSGVRYEREYHTENWLTPSQVMAAGKGDCEDLASYRAAELRHTGEDPNAKAVVVKSGPRTWHAVVKRGDGRIEDPSRVLGMGASDAGTVVGFDLQCTRVPGGWQCTLLKGEHGVSGRAPYAHDAIAKACVLGASSGGLGLIPGLDIFANIARGALDAVAPSAQPRMPPYAYPAPGGGGAVQVVQPGGAPGGLQAMTTPLDMSAFGPEVNRIAQQIQRLAHGEAQRKLRAATRA